MISIVSTLFCITFLFLYSIFLISKEKIKTYFAKFYQFLSFFIFNIFTKKLKIKNNLRILYN